MSNLGLQLWSTGYRRAGACRRQICPKNYVANANLGGEPSGHILLPDY